MPHTQHTVIKTLHMIRSVSTTLLLRNISGSDIGLVHGPLIATLHNFSPTRSATSTNNLLAYRPNFNDNHGSGLAGVFINMEGVFPCVGGTSEYCPVCEVFTNEEDGFKNGRIIIGASDCGNDIGVFGNDVATFGFAFTGCSTMTTSCFPPYSEFTIVCFLPRSQCS